MIRITHILWRRPRSIGIALSKLKKGDNEVKVTAKGTNGQLYYPNTLIVNRERAINIYGVKSINKNNLQGIFIPTADIDRGVFDA